MIERYRHPLRFYAASTAIPWGFWFAAGWVSRLETADFDPAVVAPILGVLGLFAPLATAVVLTRRDPDLRRDVAARLFSARGVTPLTGALACLLMPASILVATAISVAFGYDPGQFVITGHFTFTSGVFPVWFLLIAAPVIEELAWHSYGTDALRGRFNLLVTCLIFGAFWAFWHGPLAGIKGYYQSNLVNDGAIYAINFMVSVFPFVILMNWLYYKTKRNILVACVFHITAGYFNEIFATDPDTKIIQTGLLLVLAIALILREPVFFLRLETPPETP